MVCLVGIRLLQEVQWRPAFCNSSFSDVVSFLSSLGIPSFHLFQSQPTGFRLPARKLKAACRHLFILSVFTNSLPWVEEAGRQANKVLWSHFP